MPQNDYEPHSDDRDRLPHRVFLILAACAAIIIVVQGSTVLRVPVFDSYRWWGDESWLGIEFREQIRNGIFRHPYALGATIAQSNGLFFGSMWVTALLYGLPSLVLHSDVVATGRCVTYLLSLALLLLFYTKAQVRYSHPLAIFGLLVLISTRVFLFVSHSARYDLLSGLAILSVMLLLLQLLERGTMERPVQLGLLFGSLILVTLHSALVLIPLGVYAFYVIVRKGSVATIARFMAGLLVPIVLCILSQWITLGKFSLFGSQGAGGFQSNMLHIPAMHPLSRNILVSGILEKSRSFAEMAAFIPFVLMGCLVFEIYQAVQTRSIRSMPVSRRVAWLVVLGYFMFESSQFFYIIFVLPAIAWLVVDVLSNLVPQKRWMYHALLIGGLFLTAGSLQSVLRAKQIGARLTQDSDDANTQLRRWLDAQPIQHPIVVFASPTLHAADAWKEIRPMTTQFQIFPVDTSQSRTMDSVGVNYIEVIASGPSSYYIEEERELRALAETRGAPVLRVPGYLLDAGRSYFLPMDPRPDTLLLYRWSR